MKYSTFLFFLILSISSFGQKVVVSTKATRVTYCGFENPIEVLVEGYNNKPFSVKIDSGKLKKVDKYNYLVEPTTKGPIHLSVYDSKGKIIYSDSLGVIVLPKPLVSFPPAYRWRKGGHIPIKQFKLWTNREKDEDGYVEQFPIVLQVYFNEMCEDCSSMFNITDYDLRIINIKKDTVSYHVKNNCFDQIIKRKIAGLVVGDKVIFEEVKVTSKCGHVLSVNSIEYVLE